MAREYKTVEIDGVKYELHTVKANDEKIGSVPVRTFANTDQFMQFVVDAEAGDVELMIADWKYGNGVRLQGMARKCVSGGGFTDAAMNKVYAAMTQEECASFYRDHAGLVKFAKERWANMQKDGADDYSEDYIWDELVQ